MSLPLLRLSAIAFAFFAPSGLAQTTWYVDVANTPPGEGTKADPFTSIASAVGQPAVQSGDTLLVLPGTYVENVDFLGKTLALRSVAGAETTILRSPTDDPMVRVAGGEGPGTELEGFSLPDGPGDDTGSVFVAGSTLSIVGCTFTDASENAVHAQASTLVMTDCSFLEGDSRVGAALRAEGSDVDVVACLFVDNSATDGGAIHALASTLNLSDCMFVDNYGYMTAGSIYVQDCSSMISKCDFRSGSTEGDASGIYAIGGSLQIEDCLLADGYTFDYTGAMRLDDCAATISRTVFSDNVSCEGSGGALAIRGGEVVIRDSLFVGNKAAEGGAITIYDGLLDVRSSRFEGNLTEGGSYHEWGFGGAILVRGSVETRVERSLFVRNTALGAYNQSWGGRGGAVYGPATLTRCTLAANECGGYFSDSSGGGASGGVIVDSCILWGNMPNALGNPLDEPTEAIAVYSDVEGGWPGTDNTSVTPLFIDPDHDNYHLQPGSPCIDVGNPNQPLDLDGSRADMGAFEFVDCNGNGILDADDIAGQASADLNANGFPDECECLAYTYCQTSPNSVGAGATISFGGTSSIGQNDLTLIASDCPPNSPGIFFYGTHQDQALFGDGLRCAFGQVLRLPLVNTGPNGIGAYAVDYSVPPQPAGQITEGSTWNFQFWYRDPMGPGGSGFNSSDALEVRFCP